MRLTRATNMTLSILALLVVACSDPAGPGDNSRHVLQNIQNEAFTGTVGTTIEVGLAVTTYNGKPVKNETVLWEITKGRAVLLATSSKSDGNGEAWVKLQLDTIAGPVEVSGRLESQTVPPRSIAVIAEPGHAVRVRESSDTVYVMLKQATPAPAVFEDRYGNPITGGRTAWSLDNPNLIEIQGDSMIGLQKGATSATATLDGLTATTTVQVVAWEMVATGANHSCGLLSNGRAYCWGSNERGQLGIKQAPDICTYELWENEYPCAKTPTPVDTDLRFERIWADASITCGSTIEGHAYCWGHNWDGALGIGIDGQHGDIYSTPMPVAHNARFAKIQTNTFATTCGLTTDGDVYCWGSPFGPSIGDGQPHYETSSFPTPVQVIGGPWRDLSVGDGGACALNNEGDLYCWGARYYKSEGTQASSEGPYHEPTKFFESPKFKAIEFEGATICGIALDENTYCWGHNSFGQLGLGYTDGTHPEPTQPVLGGHQFVHIASGEFGFFCALDNDGKAYCWGFHSNGIGSPYVEGETLHCDGGRARCTVKPTAVQTDKTFHQIDGGKEHACALSTEGLIYCWGWSVLGQVGIKKEGTEIPMVIQNPLATE